MIYFLKWESLLGVVINPIASIKKVLKDSLTVTGMTELGGSVVVVNFSLIPHCNSASSMLISTENYHHITKELINVAGASFSEILIVSEDSIYSFFDRHVSGDEIGA